MAETEKAGCQASQTAEFILDIGWLFRARMFLRSQTMRLARAARRLHTGSTTLCSLEAAFVADPPIERRRWQAGDRVRIRPLAEIKSTLDSFNRCRGLYFMPSMARHCGMDATVLKRVEHIFDECSGMPKRCRGVVILKDLICDGEDVFQRGGWRCDRSCYYFWKEEWLIAVENGRKAE